jgi:hypothetical protein
MIVILITMQILGSTVTIDVQNTYGAMSMGTCKELLPIIMWNYRATEGFCWKGDISSMPPRKI